MRPGTFHNRSRHSPLARLLLFRARFATSTGFCVVLIATGPLSRACMLVSKQVETTLPAGSGPDQCPSPTGWRRRRRLGNRCQKWGRLTVQRSAADRYRTAAQCLGTKDHHRARERCRVGRIAEREPALQEPNLPADGIPVPPVRVRARRNQAHHGRSRPRGLWNALRIQCRISRP